MSFPPCRCFVIPCVLAAGVWCSIPAWAAAGNWPQWRGPDGNGVSQETGLPVAWSEQAGVVWRCKLPEWGNSTPAIWGDAIFVTSHVDDQRLVLLRINKPDGKIVWTREVGTAQTPRLPTLLGKNEQQRRHQAFHNFQNLATPSPVTDGSIVVAHFGNGDLAAYDFEGKQLWRRNLQEDYGDYTIWWGHANSPVLHGNLVISACMQDACRDLPGEISPSYVVAHDKQTGREVWKTLRPTEAEAEHGDGYTTPILHQHEGREELIVLGGEILDAYNPADGKRLWYLPGVLGNRPVTGPVAAGDLIIATRGKRGPTFAFKPGGPGERSLDEIVWRDERGTPDTPCPVVWNDLLFLLTDDGIAKCLDVYTGQVKWRERLGDGPYRASPVAAEGRVYFLSTAGLTTVVDASDRFKRLARNQLEAETLASPALSDGKIYIRGRQWLYCIK